jgi:hypothetical protein
LLRVRAGRDDFVGLRGVAVLIDLRRDSFSVEVDWTLAIPSLADLDDDDFTDPMVAICDEYPVFLFDFPSLDVRYCRSPLLFPLVLALCFVHGTTSDSSSQ